MSLFTVMKSEQSEEFQGLRDGKSRAVAGEGPQQQQQETLLKADLM